MADIEMLRKIEGLQTIELAAEKLGLKRQSAINLMSKLKREGHVSVIGGGKKVRLYKVTLWRQLPRERGMFDIINRHSPNFQVNEWFDHQVHGVYTEEDALIDAIKTRSFRLILASLRLFGHIHDWRKLYRLARKEDLVQEVGALYDVARLRLRARKIPAFERYFPAEGGKLLLRDETPGYGRDRRMKAAKDRRWRQLTQLRERDNFPKIAQKWRVYIPFNDKDIEEIR